MHAGSTVCTSKISCATAAARPAVAAVLLDVATSVLLPTSTMLLMMTQNTVVGMESCALHSSHVCIAFDHHRSMQEYMNGVSLPSTHHCVAFAAAAPRAF